MRACACARKIGSGVAPVARPRSADIPVCGFTELSRSVFRVIVWNLRLESPQDPRTGMSALRCSMRFMGDGADHSLRDGFTLERFPRRQFADDDIEHGRE